MKHEYTSKRTAELAAIGIKHPENLDVNQVAAICGSVLTQRPDKIAESDNECYQRGRDDMKERILELLGNL